MSAIELTSSELAVTIRALQIVQEQHVLETGKGFKTLYTVLEKLARAR